MVWGLDMRFLGGKREGKIKAEARAMKSVASPCGLRSGLRQSGRAFGMTTRKARATTKAMDRVRHNRRCALPVWRDYRDEKVWGVSREDGSRVARITHP